MHMLAGAVNGWQLSGYTAFQSGYPLQPLLGGNIAGYPVVSRFQQSRIPTCRITAICCQMGYARFQSTHPYGSAQPRIRLIPALTCNPTKNLHNGQRFNPNCFTTPAYGQQGPTVLPYMRAPNYGITIWGSTRISLHREPVYSDPRLCNELAESSSRTIRFGELSDESLSSLRFQTRLARGVSTRMEIHFRSHLCRQPTLILKPQGNPLSKQVPGL